MEVRILGPLELFDQGRPVQLSGGKLKRLLALLIIHANLIVPTDVFVDSLWGDEPPATASNVVQVYVSHLRRVLPGGWEGSPKERLVTKGSGYTFLIRPEELDEYRFERLAEEGHAALLDHNPVLASTKLGEALGLWRGEVLEEFRDEAFARAEIARVEGLRERATESLVEADLALGRHAMLLGKLRALVTEYPFRERYWMLLMLALYRSGRQGDALLAYQEAREALRDELGIDPSPPLRRLYADILAQNPAIEKDVG